VLVSGREWNELSNLKDDAQAMFDNSSVLITGRTGSLGRECTRRKEE
jgi:FlaA1/EpsC-like NDP-sugar epimerase